jgi:hypothetical protein
LSMKSFPLPLILTLLAPLTSLGDLLGTHTILNVLFGTPHCPQKQMFWGHFQHPLMFFLVCFLVAMTPLVIQKYIKFFKNYHNAQNVPYILLVSPKKKINCIQPNTL